MEEKPQSVDIIPYGRQHITEEDIQAVANVLRSDYLTQGPAISAFEQAFAQYVQAPHAVAVANGTAALHLAVLALGLKPGEKVITTPITFAASANCIHYAGGEVEFVDIDPNTFLIDLNEIEDKLKRSTYRGIVPVNFTGLAVDLEALRTMADKYGCWILEDACHGPGGSFPNSQGETIYAGSSRYADAAIFSFHPVKHIAAGEGGIVTTANQEVADKLNLLRTHGITKNANLFKNSVAEALGTINYKQETTNAPAFPGWYYEMQDLGFNYRLTDMQAALAHSQLTRADEGLARRRAIARQYDEAFAGMEGISTQQVPVSVRDQHHAYHLYVIRTAKRKELYDHLRAHHIFAQVHYIPVHQLPYYKERYGRQTFPHAEAYYSECLSIPMYPGMTDENQASVIGAIQSFMQSHG